MTARAKRQMSIEQTTDDGCQTTAKAKGKRQMVIKQRKTDDSKGQKTEDGGRMAARPRRQRTEDKMTAKARSLDKFPLGNLSSVVCLLSEFWLSAERFRVRYHAPKHSTDFLSGLK
jgi:hypothetical protein